MYVNTLYVVELDDGRLVCTVNRRSNEVGMFPGKYDVMPSGAFEKAHPAVSVDHEWSIEVSVFRELLEELYDKEIMAKPISPFLDYLFRQQPVRTIKDALKGGKEATLSVTGIACDLATLIIEISAILVVRTSRIREFPFSFNWEWDSARDIGEYGCGTVDVNRIQPFLQGVATQDNIVPGAAVALQLGYDWLKAHNLTD
jgi:hypothetical protein